MEKAGTMGENLFYYKPSNYIFSFLNTLSGSKVTRSKSEKGAQALGIILLTAVENGLNPKKNLFLLIRINPQSV
ncbi:hypothetical protein [Enterococcus faecalis]|uniref:hypothetical protein n=1 Tax=Enterococcus faecalis TaxID=1351 RepID=UPI002FBE8090